MAPLFIQFSMCAKIEIHILLDLFTQVKLTNLPYWRYSLFKH